MRIVRHRSVVKMTSPSEDLMFEIMKIKDNIKQKFSALKNTNYETQRQLAKQYKPLIKPLKKLTKSMNFAVKPEPTEPQTKEELTYNESLNGDDNDDDDEGNEPLSDDDDAELLHSQEEDIPSLPPSSEDEDYSIDELLSRYLKFILDDAQDEADFTYNNVYDGTSWKMGRLPVHFANNDIIIADKVYKGTPGLFELIFKKHPSSIFTENDLKTYKAMLLQTKAHLTKEGKIISSRGYKYTNIISNMFLA